jgi:hypothetical protein
MTVKHTLLYHIISLKKKGFFTFGVSRKLKTENNCNFNFYECKDKFLII